MGAALRGAMGSGGSRVCRHLWVSGRVQGVWFRESMRQEAQRLRVVGWVRNREDGRVEAVIEGPPDAVEQLVIWCHRGPPAARVENVEIRSEPVTGLHLRFEVTR